MCAGAPGCESRSIERGVALTEGDDMPRLRKPVGSLDRIRFRDSFCAATLSELTAAGSLRRFIALADQRMRFPHRGEIRVSEQTVELGDWTRIDRGGLVRVTREYVPSYGRIAAWGVRGGFPSLGAAGGAGAPLVLHRRDDEPIAVLVGFRPVTGRNNNAAAFAALQRCTASMD